jgi:hypothetical protein
VPQPNFFVVGAPKAGTTSLYNYLDQHREIYMSPVKEPNYFADEIRHENFTDEMRRMDGPTGGPIAAWADYTRLFQNVNGEKAIGEASVCYLWSKTAPANIAAKCPEARIVMVLRNPVDRAFAQYRHMLTFAKSRVSFGEHLDAFFSSNNKQIGKLYPFLEFGLYHEQVKRYLTSFPRDRIQIWFYEDYLQNPLAMLQQIFQFLEVNASFTPDVSQRHLEARVPRSYSLNRLVKRTGLWEAARRLSPAFARRIAFQSRNALTVDPADRGRLREYYRADVENLARLLNRDLSGWL